MPNDHRQRRHTLWLLCALSFILYVDRVNLATAAGAIKAELGLSNTELGIAFSAFAYSYAICQIGGGWIADRFGARITLIGCGLIWVVSTFTTGLVHSRREGRYRIFELDTTPLRAITARWPTREE